MASIRGKIINPILMGGEVINEIETPVEVRISTDMTYQAASLSTFSLRLNGNTINWTNCGARLPR